MYVLQADGSLGRHHQNPPRNAYGVPACTEYQEITLYTKDGTAIPLKNDSPESGCDEGTWIMPADWEADPSGGERGWLRFIRRPDTPLAVENLASISICGVEIPLDSGAFYPSCQVMRSLVSRGNSSSLSPIRRSSVRATAVMAQLS